MSNQNLNDMDHEELVHLYKVLEAEYALLSFKYEQSQEKYKESEARLLCLRNEFYKYTGKTPEISKTKPRRRYLSGEDLIDPEEYFIK